MTIVIPERTKLAVEEQFGKTGMQWLGELDGVLTDIASRWGVTIGEPFKDGWPTNVVYAAYAENSQYVLKTGYPNPELFTEIDVLRRWRGLSGRVQLVEFDLEIPCMLLERVTPGQTLRASRRSVDPSVAKLLSNMPADITGDHSFPTYQQWLDRAFTEYQKKYGSEHWLFEHVVAVERLVPSLMKGHEACLLHGDLHPENILLDENGDLVAIDPKGVVGPKLFEFGRFMHNFLFDSEEAVETVITERARMFSGEFDVHQIIAVGYIDLVLAITWTVNANQTMSNEQQSLLGIFRDLAQRGGGY